MRNWLRRNRVMAETARGITGISLPFGGLSWADPGPSDAEVVRQFLVFLGDRRTLYNPMQLEVFGDVEPSIHQIREQCTRSLQQLGPEAFAVEPLRAIREAGRRSHDVAREDSRSGRPRDRRAEALPRRDPNSCGTGWIACQWRHGRDRRQSGGRRPGSSATAVAGTGLAVRDGDVDRPAEAARRALVAPGRPPAYPPAARAKPERRRHGAPRGAAGRRSSGPDPAAA